jgi:hypothetical protein
MNKEINGSMKGSPFCKYCCINNHFCRDDLCKIDHHSVFTGTFHKYNLCTTHFLA